MIEINPKRSELRAASFVASNADLDDIRLLELSVNTLKSDGDENRKYKIEFDTVSINTEEIGCLLADVKLEVLLPVLDLDANNKLIASGYDDSITMVYRAQYSIPKEDIPADFGKDAIDHFADLNALMHCWQHFRYELQHITMLLGRPPFTLDSLTVRAVDDSVGSQKEHN